MPDPLPPAGWYPAPHANNEQRYWDGAQWLEPVADPGAATADQHPATEPQKPNSRRKGWIIGGSIAVGVLLVGGIGSALGAGGNAPESKPQSTVTPWHAPEREEVVVETVTVVVPDVAGMTAAEAYNAMSEAGLEPPSITSFADPLAIVLSSSPAAGEEVDEGHAIEFTVEEEPKFTLAQENAIQTARDYLAYSGFSRSGLIGQLEYEGYSTDEATFGADNAGADWNAEAAESAQQYMDYSSFSRQGLYDQLAYEGFTPEQIESGLAAVGY
jgi:hypothetical protein